MSDEDKTKGAGAGEGGTGEGGGDKTKSPPPPGQGGAGEGGKPPAGAPGTQPGGESGKPGPKVIKDDDDIESDDPSTMMTLSASALRKRLERASKSSLRDIFGIDDKEKIRQQWKDAQTLTAKAEEDRRAKLKDEEKLKEDVQKERTRAEQAEARAAQVEESRVVDAVVRRTTKLASKHIDADYVDDIVHGAFKRHCADLSDKELERFDEKAIEAWFETYAKEKPKFAKEAPKKEERPKVPANNGTNNNHRPAPSANGSGQKDPRPGRENSMTKKEYADYRAEQMRTGSR